MDISEEIANNFSGPIIYNYIWWIMREAQKRKIKRLYFLARDGYTLKKIADIFCEKFNLNIECRYLYCSRASLRMPTYFFLGEEAFDLLLLWGYNITLKSVLLRADLEKNERLKIYSECGISIEIEDILLSKKEYSKYAESLRKSRTFRRYIQEKSRKSYSNAIGYFLQQGLFDYETVTIVDSGWTGSIQRSLRQLLEFSGYTGKMIGFYFGMNENQKSLADGEYLTWYFNVETGMKNKAFFCNNLFECILSAPHGMTKEYKNIDSDYIPVLISPPNSELKNKICRQSENICNFCKSHANETDFTMFPPKNLKLDTEQRIKRYMFKPTLEEAKYFGEFMFCDDITESYHMPLASESEIEIIKENSFIIKRIIKRVSGKGTPKGISELFWPYGTIAFISRKREWYRWNIYVWEWIKAVSRRKNSKKQKNSINNWCSLVDPYSIVSFDLFDTLVYRVVNNPKDVFYLMEPWVERQLGIHDFCEKRCKAEQRARKLVGEEEVSLSKIYEIMGMNNENSKLLEEYEKKVELNVIRADNRMKELLRYCVENGKKVMIITDMYQSKSFIQEVLNCSGINGVYTLFVSSSLGYTKHSGNLFRYIAKSEKINDLKEWVHIGDNDYSDYLIPRRLGIRSALYKNERQVLQNKNAVNFATQKIRNWCRVYRDCSKRHNI